MLVVDASVALAWCLGDEDAGRLDGVLRRLLGEGGLAPGQWALEVTNALRTAERRGRIDATDVDAAETLLRTLPVDIVATDLPTAMAALAAARSHGLTTYDAAYLELARTRGLAIATLDDHLADACRAAGVEVAL